MATVWYRGSSPGAYWIEYNSEVLGPYIAWEPVKGGGWVPRIGIKEFGGPALHEAVLRGVESGSFEISYTDPVGPRVWVEVGEVR